MIPKIYLLRVWRPNKNKIFNRFFLKSEVLFGSDVSADIKLEQANGIIARLDCSSLEIIDLKSGQISKIESNELFQVGESVCQLREVSKIPVQSKWTITGLCASVLLLFFIHFLRGEKEKQSCSELAQNIQQGIYRYDGFNEDIQNSARRLAGYKSEFKQAIKEKQWVKARSELSSLFILFEDIETPHCSLLQAKEVLEGELSKNLISYYLREKNPKSAAEELAQYSQKYQNDSLLKLKSRILRLAKKQYYEGYRLEDENPAKGAELMEASQEICLLLGETEKCFENQGDAYVQGKLKEGH